MKIALEYDDFGPVNSNFGLLEKLHETYPNFKVTLFTVPWDIRWAHGITGSVLQEAAAITKPDYKAWVDAVNDCKDWIEIAIHGLTHAPMEFAELSYEAAMKRMVIGMKMFQNKILAILSLM